jgi:RHS Repeat
MLVLVCLTASATSVGIPSVSHRPSTCERLVRGSGFGATQSNSTLNFFYGVPAQIISWSDTEIQAIVPNGATSGDLYVLVGGVEGDSSSSFSVATTTDLADSFGNQSNYNFDTIGGSWSLTSSEGPGCSTCTVRGNIVETADANGNVLTHTDDLGHVTTYTYDSVNDVTSSSQQLDANTPVTTTYTYNSFGEVLTVTDALGNVTTNNYDGNGNLPLLRRQRPTGTPPPASRSSPMTRRAS